ncbi:MAG: SemiSWEET transporter [Cellvibrionaceae bacterium]|nr:SemiSWEET transporter [Cellvibrionaceae bacterium]
MFSPEVIGYLAAFFTTFSFAPQAVLTLRTRDTSALSLGMYSMFVTGVTIWLLYGWMKSDGIIMLANGLTLLLALPILGMKIFNRLWGNERSAP